MQIISWLNILYININIIYYDIIYQHPTIHNLNQVDPLISIDYHITSSSPNRVVLWIHLITFSTNIVSIHSPVPTILALSFILTVIHYICHCRRIIPKTTQHGLLRLLPLRSHKWILRVLIGTIYFIISAFIVGWHLGKTQGSFCFVTVYFILLYFVGIFSIFLFAVTILWCLIDI